MTNNNQPFTLTTRVMERVGEAVRERRKTEGLSLREVADRAGCGHDIVFRIERGTKQDIELSNLIGILSALGLSLAEIAHKVETEQTVGV